MASKSQPRALEAELQAELQAIICGLVAEDRSVRNCVVSVANGDGSFAWSGAAGNARADVPMHKNTPIYIASVTKLYTATIVMMLFERGSIALDDPIAKYLPRPIVEGIHVYAGTDFSNQITIRQLLGHRSGIADYYTGKARDGKSLFDEFLENPKRRWTVLETIERAKQLTSNFAPGAGTSYSDTNFQLLGILIERVTGKPLQAVFEELIFRPHGLGHTWLVGFFGARSPSPVPADVFLGNTNATAMRSNGSYWADGGMVSTADEMVGFLRALKGGRLIRHDTLAMMHDWRRWKFPVRLGLGTICVALPLPLAKLAGMPPMWGHSGSTGAFLYHVAEADLFIAGTIGQIRSRLKPLMLVRRIINAAAR
jgi:D-alanyl-D-alanine carboxypeptidase